MLAHRALACSQRLATDAQPTVLRCCGGPAVRSRMLPSTVRRWTFAPRVVAKPESSAGAQPRRVPTSRRERSDQCEVRDLSKLGCASFANRGQGGLPPRHPPGRGRCAPPLRWLRSGRGRTTAALRATAMVVDGTLSARCVRTASPPESNQGCGKRRTLLTTSEDNAQ